MFKLIKWLVVLVVVLVAVGLGALYLSLGGIIKSVVQKEGTAQLNVPTTLGSAALGLTSGSISFKDFAIGSPAGFTAPHMLEVGGLKVDTAGFTHLRDKPLQVTDIQVDSPHMVIEQHGMSFNFKALLDGLPNHGESTPSPATANANPTRLIIDLLSINNPVVDIIPDASGTVTGVTSGALGALGGVGQQLSAAAGKRLGAVVKPMTLTLPTVTVKNIGNADGQRRGAEIKDVATAVIQAIVTEAAKQRGLPFDPALLEGNLGSLKGKLTGDLQQQLQQQAGKLGAGKLLDGVLGGGK